MKFGLTSKEIKAVQSIFKAFPQVREVTIFGSRAIGNFKKASDIDLALKGEGLDLSLVGKIKSCLEETTPLPYFFDLVDFNTVTNPEFKKHIQQYGQIFFKAHKV